MLIYIGGLDDRSRIGQRFMGLKTSLNNVLTAKVADYLIQLIYGLSDSKKTPKLITKDLITENTEDLEGYSDPAEMKNKRKDFMNKYRRQHGER